MRIARLHLVLPARFAKNAGLDARTIAEAAASALHDTHAPPALRIAMPGNGAAVQALSWRVAAAVKNQAKGG